VPAKKFHLHTIRQLTAGVLLMFALGIFGGKADFEQWHLHSGNEPIIPTTTVPYRATGGNVSAGVLGFEPRAYVPVNERCPSCGGTGLGMSRSLILNDCTACAGTGRKMI
jgi:hypothetical protein